jgi:hypothetical protein
VHWLCQLAFPLICRTKHHGPKDVPDGTVKSVDSRRPRARRARVTGRRMCPTQVCSRRRHCAFAAAPRHRRPRQATRRGKSFGSLFRPVFHGAPIARPVCSNYDLVNEVPMLGDQDVGTTAASAAGQRVMKVLQERARQGVSLPLRLLERQRIAVTRDSCRGMRESLVYQSPPHSAAVCRRCGPCEPRISSSRSAARQRRLGSPKVLSTPAKPSPRAGTSTVSTCRTANLAGRCRRLHRRLQTSRSSLTRTRPRAGFCMSGL